MKKLTALATVAVTLALFAGCSNQIENPEMQQCAQQNYQCEASCEQRSTADSLVSNVCTNKCIEAYNQCKANAEQLGAMQ
ncbi:hypothetical protein [Pseudoalteromonas mariniglutinosa]|uniref:hypothetical protein n=1 Tax=Pseudoalteromonas mariniglutinosa TaxID=206042 RepID=UPI00384FF13A